MAVSEAPGGMALVLRGSLITLKRKCGALTATAEYWSLVFPLGMYAAATHQTAERVGWPALVGLSRGFLAIAAAAWLFGVVVLGGREVRAVAPADRAHDHAPSI